MVQPADITPQPLMLLNAREAAAYLRVSLSTLNRLERTGALNPLRMPSGHRRYTVELLNRCLAASEALNGENH